jgi:hypothetical protein
MTTEDEVKEIANTLERKSNLKAYEQQFLDVYNKRTCDSELVRDLQLQGLNRYVKPDSAADFKESNKNFRAELKEQVQSLKGNWREAPPEPPALPSCCIM